MRLWHKDLLDVLPKNQFIGQYRELCSILKDLNNKYKVNHILINFINKETKGSLVLFSADFINEYKNRYNKIPNSWEKNINKCYLI